MFSWCILGGITLAGLYFFSAPIYYSASVHEYLICPDKHGVGNGDGVLFYFDSFQA